MIGVAQRNKAVRALREFFSRRDLIEVFSPLMVRSTAIEPYIDPLEVHSAHEHFENGRYTLPTSPEFSMKKMFGTEIQNHAGIYEIAHAFRDDYVSDLHYPAFTMVEWYLKNYSYLKLPGFVAAILQHLCECLGAECDTGLTYFTITELFVQYAYPTYTNAMTCDEYIRVYVQKFGKEFVSTGHETTDMTEIFSQLFDTFAMPEIRKHKGLVAVYDYPHFLAALAETNAEKTALRTECFMGGAEIANGYQELSDATEIMRRARENSQMRRLLQKKVYEEDLGLAEAAFHMQGVAGMALGLERVLMKLLGIRRIKDFYLY